MDVEDFYTHVHVPGPREADEVEDYQQKLRELLKNTTDPFFLIKSAETVAKRLGGEPESHPTA